MAAPEGYGCDCRARCQKLTVEGTWRCNLMAISGNPFCEKHYALEVKKLQDFGIGEFLSGEEEEMDVFFSSNEGVSLRKRGAPKASMSKGKEKVLIGNDNAGIRIGGRGGGRPNGVKIKREMQGEDQGGDEGNEAGKADEVSDVEQVFGYFQVDDVCHKRRPGRPIGSKKKKEVTRKMMERPEGSKKKDRYPIKTEVNETDGNKPALVRLSKEEEIGVSGDNIKKRGRGRPRKVDPKHGSSSRGDDHVLMGKERGKVLSEYEQNVKRSSTRVRKRGETSGAGLFKEDEIITCMGNMMKRGRGRPKKVDTKHELDTCGDDDVVSERDIRDVPSDYEESVKRPRGRPKKVVEPGGVWPF